jgi:hypothetical protein
MMIDIMEIKHKTKTILQKSTSGQFSQGFVEWPPEEHSGEPSVR